MRAGVPERVAMMLTGRKTRSLFEGDNIVSERDLRDAGRKLAGTIVPLLPDLAGDGRLHPTDFPHEEAHRIPVGLPDFKSGVGL